MPSQTVLDEPAREDPAAFHSSEDDTENTPQVSQDLLDFEARRLCRMGAASLITLMADTDTSFALLAERLGRSEITIRKWFRAMVDGTEDDIRRLSYFATAMGCRLDFHVETPVALGPYPVAEHAVGSA